MATARKFHVGQRVWSFDENRRVYPKNERGKSFGAPIFAEHFREKKVLGIVGKSYLIGLPDGGLAEKVSFASAERCYYDDQGREDRMWLDDSRHKVARMVECCRDTAVLRQVAALIGYDAEAK